MDRRASKNQLRKNSGSVLFLAMVILAFIIVPAGIIVTKQYFNLTRHSLYQTGMEAASLLAAQQISKIVINDPHFGFVSLSNQPPIGRATLAADGEPCPVNSINNILATIRLDTIMAHKLYSDDLCVLANEDYEQAQRALTQFQYSLKSAVDPSDPSVFVDMDGNEIKVYTDAYNLLEKNLRLASNGRSIEIRNFHISLGWLRQGGMTNTPVPEPEESADFNRDWQQNKKYRACVDIPVFGQSFIFAPVVDAPALADEAMFAAPDGVHFCSVVKLEADIEEPGESAMADQVKRQWIHISACAVPAENRQVGPSGALLVFFPCGLIEELRSLNDLLRLPDGNEEPAQFYKAESGDLPVDADTAIATATLEPWGQQNITSSRVVAAGLYCWLRAAGVKPRIDSTLTALRQEFSRSLKSSNLLYEFDPDGNVNISSLPGMPLPASVLSDEQLFVETRGEDYSISCYNNVYHMGTINGGKHAGLPLTGDPVNWCDLPYFGLSVENASEHGKGAATGLTANNEIQIDSQIPGAVFKDLVEFKVNGHAVSAKPRKSYYSGGLAVELSISAL